ncbi:MAG: hypothetical protein KDB86_04415 [Actinobacteria bacterium]|nr:hypothetical protein [Actinomycetota bacterium]MCB9388282.1 hypothetical protein [Acidimicrobiia bacterium]
MWRLALAVAVLTAVVLSACSSNDNNGTDTTTTQPAVTTTVFPSTIDVEAQFKEAIASTDDAIPEESIDCIWDSMVDELGEDELERIIAAEDTATMNPAMANAVNDCIDTTDAQ